MIKEMMTMVIMTPMFLLTYTDGHDLNYNDCDNEKDYDDLFRYYDGFIDRL
jgi:hypothetical protein